MIKRVFVLFTVILLVISVFSACNGIDTGAKDTKADSSKAGETKGPDYINLMKLRDV
jgi:uncharacterized membrane protein